MAKWDMSMLLPKGIPTLQHWVTNKYSRPDNIFGTRELTDLVVKCNTIPERQSVKTDHIPIVLILDISKSLAPITSTRNYRMTDWSLFREDLDKRLKEAPEWTAIDNEEEFNRQVETLMQIIQESIEARVPLSKPNPLSKRWWTKELNQMKKEGYRLSRTSYKFRALPKNRAHHEYKEHRRQFADAITIAKRQHWEDFLEEATEREMWIANKFIKEPVGDGGRPRIPTLKINTPDGYREVSSNKEKAQAIATAFFPSKPEGPNTNGEYQSQPHCKPVYLSLRCELRPSQKHYHHGKHQD